MPRLIIKSLSIPYALFGWNPKCNYKVIGSFLHNDDESVLLFNLKDTEILIPDELLNEKNGQCEDTATNKNKPAGRKNSIIAFPKEWIDSFGQEYYAQEIETSSFSSSGRWNTQDEGKAFPTSESLKVTEKDEIRKKIESIIGNKEVINERSGTN